MACFLLNKSNITITIPKVEEIDKVSFYEIFVKVGTVSWKVKHRYSDFVNLNDKLVIDHCVNKDILPPKKIIGKRDPVFVEKRRVGLENYLMSVITFLRETMPRTLAEFLDFHKYDILFLLQDMSSSFLRDGDSILLQSKRYQFNPLQVLEHFGRRAACICLDNEKPSQKELDTVAVMLALKVVKEGKTPVFSRTIEPTYPNSPQ
uniref:PX domain-containing protein n=1 Tax=Graphocephala atropunctata TaxID=36148 RepID=A0A1B6MTC8_9HEMI